MILAGDIGGTKTRIALYERTSTGLRARVEETYKSAEHEGLVEIVAAFRSKHPERVEHAGFGVAGPVKDGASAVTNLDWTIDARELARALALDSVSLVNDLEATALGIRELARDDLVCLNGGASDARGNQAVIAAGTGLGQAGLFWNGREHVPFGSEAGHADFAPADRLQDELLEFLREDFEHVSWERVLSGPGLFTVYRFLRDTKRGEEPAWLTKEIAAGDPTVAVSKAGIEASSKLCSDALDLFVALYGTQAGNFALGILATGGVYIGGGIAPKILKKLEEPTFMRAFKAKSKLVELLAAIPVHVILNDRCALLGAAGSTRSPARS